MASIEWFGSGGPWPAREVSGIWPDRNRRAPVWAGLPALALLVLPLAAQEPEEGLIIRKLDFEGNRSIESPVLAASISTTNSSIFARSPLLRWVGWGEKRRLNEREFRRDVERLRVFYGLRGFPDMEVDTVVVRTDRDVYISFRIREGEPLRIRSLAIHGVDSLPGRRTLLRDLPLRVGDPYDQLRINATGDTIQTRLRDRGYPTASVFLLTPQLDREARTADLTLMVDPGAPAIIGGIRVEGTRVVDPSLVRSLLVTAPGRPYRLSDLFSSQRNLYRSDLFRYAAVEIDTADFTVGNPSVPLKVTVSEGPLNRARASLGYATYECFRFGIGWARRNALGYGQIFDAYAQLSKLGVGDPVGAERSWLCGALDDDLDVSRRPNYAATVAFRRPAFASPSNDLTLTLFAERRSEYRVYLRDDIGGSVTLTRETARRIPVALTYRLSYGGTDANAVSFCAFFNACTEADVGQLRERRLIATASVTGRRVRVNNLLDPTRGSAISVEVTHSSQAIGSSEFAQFTRLSGDAAWYRPLGGAVLALHARAGLVFAPELRLSGGATNFVPPEQRFYAGGPNDVRGYNRNELGPVVYLIPESALDTTAAGEPVVPEDEVTVAPTGGNAAVIGNAEIRVPSPVLSDRLFLGLFVDAGAVWERGTGRPAPVIRFTPGAGVRFLTPLGPVRLDVAYNPYALPSGPLYARLDNDDLELRFESYRRPSDRGGRLNVQISVGHAF